MKAWAGALLVIGALVAATKATDSGPKNFEAVKVWFRDEADTILNNVRQMVEKVTDFAKENSNGGAENVLMKLNENFKVKDDPASIICKDAPIFTSFFNDAVPIVSECVDKKVSEITTVMDKPLSESLEELRKMKEQYQIDIQQCEKRFTDKMDALQCKSSTTISTIKAFKKLQEYMKKNMPAVVKVASSAYDDTTLCVLDKIQVLIGSYQEKSAANAAFCFKRMEKMLQKEFPRSLF